LPPDNDKPRTRRRVRGSGFFAWFCCSDAP